MKTVKYQPEYLISSLVKKRDFTRPIGTVIQTITQGFYYGYCEDENIIFYTKHICAN